MEEWGYGFVFSLILVFVFWEAMTYSRRRGESVKATERALPRLHVYAQGDAMEWADHFSAKAVEKALAEILSSETDK
jgi:hypothetical protein